MQKEKIVVFSAHSDDFVLGAGGTLAKYAKEGHKVLAIVFSYGERSHPWLKKKVVKKMRADETFEASKILGCKTIFLNLYDQKIKEEYKDKGEEKLLKVLKRFKPTKIFTHSGEDIIHPDHKAVHNITLDVYEKLAKKPEVYVYSVWNPVSLIRSYPALYVNIKKYFKIKLKALKTYRSQKIHVSYPTVLLFFKAIKHGLKIRTIFGEKFYRIK